MIKRSQSAHRSSDRAVRPPRSILKKYLTDTAGSVVVQMLIFSLLIFGMAGLVITVGRIYVINTAAQAYVDQIALAAAAELDNRSDSIERARRAAFGEDIDPDDPDGVLKKLAPFGVGIEDLVEVEELMFLESLPDDQGYQYEVRDLPPEFTTDPTDANFVVVVARPISIFSVLLPITEWTGAPGVLTTRAVAVASLQRQLCDRPMFMICNPFETATEGDADSFADGVANDGEGYQIMVTKHSGGGQLWAPGEFGTIDLDAYFDPADVDFCKGGGPNSPPLQKCLLGVHLPARVCATGTVNLDPGNGQNIIDGFNTRFDVWSQQTMEYRGSDLFPPDYVVTKGLVNGVAPGSNANDNDCKEPTGNSGNGWVDSTTSVALPQADCFANWQVDCPDRITDLPIYNDSNQINELVDYFNVNHAPYDGDAYSLGTDGLGGYWVEANGAAMMVPVADPVTGVVTNELVNTRYKAYLWEVDQLQNGLAATTQLATANPGDPSIDYEYMAPACTPWDGGENPGLPGRRKIVTAVVNCLELEDEVKGNGSGIAVSEYVEMFVTEPVRNNSMVSSDDDMFAEIIRIYRPEGTGGDVHEYPLLNR